MLSLKHRVELVLDVSSLNRNINGVTKRNFELDHFHCAYKIDPSSNYQFLRNLLVRLPKLIFLFRAKKIHIERSLGFNSEALYFSDGSYLSGYWQSHLYFESVREVIANDLRPIESLSDASEKIDKLIANENSVAIHVRRGDYVSLPAASNFHGVVSLEYYSSAIMEAKKRVMAPRFFIFSDDLPWCIDNLPLNQEELVLVDCNDSAHAWQDLILMGRCKNHIIANSSFSWWGAWLGDQKLGRERFVAAPKKWFVGKENNLRDRVPAHWVLL